MECGRLNNGFSTGSEEIQMYRRPPGYESYSTLNFLCQGVTMPWQGHPGNIESNADLYRGNFDQVMLSLPMSCRSAE